MKIKDGLPPNYATICKAFPFIKDRPSIVFVYGDTLYRRGSGRISVDLRAHEETHVRQQGKIGADEWWRRYIEEPIFRLAQEVEAYHNQYRRMSNVDKLREIRRIAGDLSGPMYGNLCTFEEAKQMIRTGSVCQEAGRC